MKTLLALTFLALTGTLAIQAQQCDPDAIRRELDEIRRDAEQLREEHGDACRELGRIQSVIRELRLAIDEAERRERELEWSLQR